MLVPRPVGWGGGELPDSGSTIGDEKQRPVPRLSDQASGTRPPNVAENNNMPIRRIYNKPAYILIFLLRIQHNVPGNHICVDMLALSSQRSTSQI